MPVALALILGTLLSEDLTCISAGLLIHHGQLDAFTGVTACTVGIIIGDCSLWAIGRVLGVTAFDRGWLKRALDHRRVLSVRAWLAQHAPKAIVATRFLPGTRMPFYLIAGVTGTPFRVFVPWDFVGALLWTPALVMLTATLGDTFATRATSAAGKAFLPSIAAAAVVLILLYLARIAASPSRRADAAVRIARWSRWEFWPMWLFYGPVALWVALLALRHRGVATITAANPGIADGGTIGESKAEILAKLPPDVTIPFARIPAGEVASRLDAVRVAVEREGWSYPLILKPDVGERGSGIKLAREMADVEQYLNEVREPLVLQPYHDGPFEAGIFYYRMPEWSSGRILSITDKHFPSLVGDGQSTLEALVRAHPRYRLQARLFLARHRAHVERVLEPGETFRLAVAGNHAQGTMFRDGAHLVTPALEARVDEIARRVDGFFVGRFDVRYRDVDAFKAGRDLAIVELNGAMAESTNIYDPDTSLWSAYRQLFRQWSIVFAIGAANRKRGAPVSSHRRLFGLVRAHLFGRRARPLAD